MGTLPSQIGPYRVVRKLGEGGMGAVYEAVHQVISRRVAVKVLHPDAGQSADSINRFLNEARAANLIGHPGLVQITDFGNLPDGSGYLVMEYLAGDTLAARLKHSGGKLPPEDAVQIAVQFASALAACHKKGIIHRDLKPGNAMLVPDPAMPTGERLKVLDFGLAKLSEVLEAAFVKTHSAAVLGTPLYMSPEQCEGAGRVDAKTDVYALGCILYEMLAGRPPFWGEGTGQVIGQHLFKQPEPLSTYAPQVPAGLSELVARLLVKSKDERPTMRETQKALEALAQELPPPHRHETAEPSGAATADTMPALGLASTLGQGAGEPGTSRVPWRPPRRMMVTAGLVALFALGVLIWVTRAPRLAAPLPSPVVVAAPPAAKQVTLRVESEPPGALVIDDRDNEILGKTPWQRTAAPRAGQLDLTLRLSGHQDHAVTVNLSADDRAYVALTPKPAATSSRPSPATSKPAAPPKKKPVLKRMAAPFKKLAGKIADKFKKKPAGKAK